MNTKNANRSIELDDSTNFQKEEARSGALST